MKIVHTSDWHAGRVWKGINRLDELEAVLDHLAGYIEEHQVDLVLHSGDVFDNRTPSANAEEIVFRFFKRVGESGAKTVVIAGNHDSRARLRAWGQLTEVVDVQVVDVPRRPDAGGVLEIETRCGETAVVAAIPFAAPRDFMNALEFGSDDVQPKQIYADSFRRIVEALAARFRHDTVNVLMAHTHLDGVLIAGTERRVHLGDEWAATPQALPATASYIALGHIHRPQRVESAPAPAWYVGSPLQLDFGEVDELKFFNVVTATPGKPAVVEQVPYQGAKPLTRRSIRYEELAVQAASLCDAGWLKLTVVAPHRIPDLALEVRSLVPNAVSIVLETPETSAAFEDVESRGQLEAHLAYQAWWREVKGTTPDRAVIEAFSLLHNKHSEASAEDAPAEP